MTSPTEQRRSFDAAMDAYRAGDSARALAVFTDITAAAPGMSDAWLGRMACGDHDIDTVAAAHRNSRALYRETRRIGLPDGIVADRRSLLGNALLDTLNKLTCVFSSAARYPLQP